MGNFKFTKRSSGNIKGRNQAGKRKVDEC